MYLDNRLNKIDECNRSQSQKFPWEAEGNPKRGGGGGGGRGTDIMHLINTLITSSTHITHSFMLKTPPLVHTFHKVVLDKIKTDMDIKALNPIAI